MMNFKERVSSAVKKNNSLVCVGLDPDPEIMPGHINDLFRFNKAIIDATKDLVCAYKPNSAFYEAGGAPAVQALKETCDYIKSKVPGIPIILDYKRADIGNTNLGYITYAFDYLGVDAVTVSPYMGQESLQPYLDIKDKGIIVLCRTSNPGAGEFQDLEVNGKKLYLIVAEKVRNKWNKEGNCALVAGAPYPEELAELRSMMGPEMLFLVPGLGPQGGDIEKTVIAGVNVDGEGIIINSSRGIIYASSGEDFAEAARLSTIEFRDTINKYRKVKS